MGKIATRAEEIAGHLIGRTLGGIVIAFDREGRQGAVDFHVALPDGTTAALEVTLTTSQAVMEWEGNADGGNWRWQAQNAWEYRPHSHRSSYRRARAAAVELAKLCDQRQVEDVRDLHATTRDEALTLLWLNNDLAGTLHRSTIRQEPGIHVNLAVRIEIVEDHGPQLPDLLEEWLEKPHVLPHLEKLRADEQVDERHLFFVPVLDALPSTCTTDDFPPPSRVPRGYEGIEHLWIWSEYWHRFLHLSGNAWEWVRFPHDVDAGASCGVDSAPE